MKLVAAHLAGLDSSRDRKAHDAFTRLVREPEAPIHAADLRPILTWLCTQLDEMREQLDAQRRRQDPEFHNPENGT